MALFEGHDRLLEVAWLEGPTAEQLFLALHDDRVDCLHLHLEEALNRLCDRRLRGIERDAEDDLIGFGQFRRLLRDYRREDDVVIDAHARRSSIASSAAVVSTSFSRFIMS